MLDLFLQGKVPRSCHQQLLNEGHIHFHKGLTITVYFDIFLLCCLWGLEYLSSSFGFVQSSMCPDRSEALPVLVVGLAAFRFLLRKNLS